MDRDSNAPIEHHDVNSLPKPTRDRLGEWNGILWLDYLNSDGAAARAHLEAERQEIEELEKEEQERESKTKSAANGDQTSHDKPAQQPDSSSTEPGGASSNTSSQSHCLSLLAILISRVGSDKAPEGAAAASNTENIQPYHHLDVYPTPDGTDQTGDSVPAGVFNPVDVNRGAW